MNEASQQSFVKHAALVYPHECCGLIIKTKTDEIYFACENKAEKPTDHFIISAEDFAKAEDLGEVLAVCHSHPDATSKPSEYDIAACNSGDLPWYILAWPD